MHNENRKYGFKKRIPAFCQSLVFFLLFFLYLWFVVDLRLIHHGAGIIRNFPVFFTGFDFFFQFTKYPAGILEYVCALLAQTFYFAPLGAAVVTLQACLLTITTDYYLKAINAASLRSVRFIPPILILVTFANYEYHFTVIMPILITLASVVLYINMQPKIRRLHFLGYIIFSSIVYYIAGAAFLLFALLCTIYEMFFNRRSKSALLYLIAAAVIPYVLGVLVFGLDIIDALTEMLPCSPRYLSLFNRKKIIFLVCAMYLLTPAATAIWLLVRPLITKKLPQKQTAGLNLYYCVGLALPVLLALGISFISLDRTRKNLFEIDYYTSRTDWDRVIKAADRSKKPTTFVSYAANLALYHTGRLAEDMFKYPQNKTVLFLSESEHQFMRWRRFDICIRFGFLNKAESDLTESIETLGPKPLLLKRLATINIAKGNLDTAKIYLNALRKSLFFADWAGQYLKKIQTDPTMSSDPDIQNLRSLMLKDESQNLLSALFDKTPKNKMAFEYLMAYYLVTRQTDLFVQKLDLLDQFGYDHMPRHYQEAVLSHIYTTGKTLPFLKKVNPQTIQVFEDFLKEYKSFGTNQKQAKKKLAPEFGDTYFFYYIYGY